MNRSDYIIDFDRVNQLTASIYDDPNDKLIQCLRVNLLFQFQENS
jgi:hypothetical protein